ncbi:zinc finger, C2H2 type [Oesophagostomum dentatum]|uniref:Zinc finger, C2H2 type n=1 Tax=Oesophagostomum dentatum TaxID=61180 RepID=A0A0B1T2C4_OESDE|nr:zinc finger, C2H2 type [Oesophagostomum dentatum]
MKGFQTPLESKENTDAELEECAESEIERRVKEEECPYECRIVSNNNVIRSPNGCHAAGCYGTERRAAHPSKKLEIIVLKLRSKRSISEPAEIIAEKCDEQEQTCSFARPKKDRSCPFCSEVFASMQSRKRHITRRHPDRANDKLVNLHMYSCVPSKELPFICDTCHKTFSNVSSLHSHCKSIHEGIKDFICSVCKKAYGRACEL